VCLPNVYLLIRCHITQYLRWLFPLYTCTCNLHFTHVLDFMFSRSYPTSCLYAHHHVCIYTYTRYTRYMVIPPSSAYILLLFSTFIENKGPNHSVYRTLGGLQSIIIQHKNL
jgi:hypothetical protein